MMKLKEYIEKEYGGNQSAFGRAHGARHDLVGKWIKQGYLFVDGEIYSPIKRRKKITQPAEEE